MYFLRFKKYIFTWYIWVIKRLIYRHLGYERVYLPLYQVADTPFHIQGDDMILFVGETLARSIQVPLSVTFCLPMYLGYWPALFYFMGEWYDFVYLKMT